MAPFRSRSVPFQKYTVNPKVNNTLATAAATHHLRRGSPPSSSDASSDSSDLTPPNRRGRATASGLEVAAGTNAVVGAAPSRFGSSSSQKTCRNVLGAAMNMVLSYACGWLASGTAGPAPPSADSLADWRLMLTS